jgi:hypothetical protein
LGRWGAAFDDRSIIPPELEGFLPVKRDYPIGAVIHAVAAADAFFSIMHGNPVVELVHGLCRTAPDTWSIFTLIAKGRCIVVSDIRECSYSFGYFAGPENPLREVIFVLTGYAAGAAADTTLKVDDHGIFWHFFPSLYFLDFKSGNGIIY